MEKEVLIQHILDHGALEIRDLSAGEAPFLYSSGNYGPGYVMIKGLVSQRLVMDAFCEMLGHNIRAKKIDVDFVAGNVTGGMVPGWVLSTKLDLPFVYVRAGRKKGGQKEHITGLSFLNRAGDKGMSCSKALIVEELVNFAETTCRSAEVIRKEGCVANFAATILSYDNPEAKKHLQERGIELISLFTLKEVIDYAEKMHAFPQNAIDDYREFLKDPLRWQEERGFTPEEGGTVNPKIEVPFEVYNKLKDMTTSGSVDDYVLDLLNGHIKGG